MDVLLQDLRYAVRRLARSPSFTAVAVATLALGIGANTAIFGAIDAVLLEALPYPEAERIVTLWQRNRRLGVERDDVSPANFLDWRERSRSFEALAAAEPYTKDHIGPDGPERLRTWRVTEGFFGVFDVPALLGRALRADDYAPGAPPVVVLSHRLWQRRFGGDPAIVGRTLTLDDEPTTVVGVMPPGFGYPPGRDLWIPRLLEGSERRTHSAYWQVVGTLRTGVALESAQAELDAIAVQLAEERPDTNAEVGIVAVALGEQLVGGLRPTLLLFFGAVVLVLLIACVNVASLLLARAAGRRRELAVRAALGAGRARVARQLATEALVLAALAGVLGVAVAASSLAAFAPVRPERLPHVDGFTLDGRVLLFAAVLTLGSAVLFGLAPAVHAARTDLRAWSHARAPRGLRGASRGRAALVVCQLALATVLLVAAGLLVRSFVALLDVERGFRTENVLALTVQAWRYYPDAEQRGSFVVQALERIGALPGVLAAGVTSSLPLAEDIGADTATFSIAGRAPSDPESEPTAHTTVVTEGFFRALGIPLRRGRLAGPADDAAAPPVVVINEAMARRYWPGEDPLGAAVTLRFDGRTWTAEVIGVVADVRHELREEPRPTFFVPYGQHPTGALHFTVRTAGDPAALVRAVQAEISRLNPRMPFAAVTTLDGLLDGSLRERRFALLLVLAFAGTALALAALGTYGLLAYEASRRTHEIGVRMALGARRERLLRAVVGEGVRLTLIGLAIGAVLAAGATQLLTRFLFAVGAFDPVAFATAAALLVAVAALASWLPARRAAGVDPMAALRDE